MPCCNAASVVVPNRAEACNSLPRMTKVSNEIGLYSGGGTCRNRALGDTFLKFGMVSEQAVRFSKTTGYKLTHAAGGCSCKKNKLANDGHQTHHASATTDCIFKHNTNFMLFLSMRNGFNSSQSTKMNLSFFWCASECNFHVQLHVCLQQKGIL